MYALYSRLSHAWAESHLRLPNFRHIWRLQREPYLPFHVTDDVTITMTTDDCLLRCFDMIQWEIIFHCWSCDPVHIFMDQWCDIIKFFTQFAWHLVLRLNKMFISDPTRTNTWSWYVVRWRHHWRPDSNQRAFVSREFYIDVTPMCFTQPLQYSLDILNGLKRLCMG